MDPVSFRPDVKNGLSERLRGTFRFDAFELDIRSRELRKHGIRIRLQNKSFQFLIALLERPGEVVTRQELQRHLWPGDTLVDFESGLNTAAKRLRVALSDSADKPRYIETVARAGYRFIAPIAKVEASDARPVTRAPALKRGDDPRPSLRRRASVDRNRRRFSPFVRRLPTAGDNRRTLHADHIRTWPGLWSTVRSRWSLSPLHRPMGKTSSNFVSYKHRQPRVPCPRFYRVRPRVGLSSRRIGPPHAAGSNANCRQRAVTRSDERWRSRTGRPQCHVRRLVFRWQHCGSRSRRGRCESN